jgi:hypothetical protein
MESRTPFAELSKVSSINAADAGKADKNYLFDALIASIHHQPLGGIWSSRSVNRAIRPMMQRYLGPRIVSRSTSER